MVFAKTAVQSLLAVGVGGAAVSWRLSVEGQEWQDRNSSISNITPAVPSQLSSVPLQILVNSSDARQAMEGFGGCFNEKGWDALMVLDEAERDAVIQALFSDAGLRWKINRMPIGASDFADSYYSLDDFPGDLDMVNLTLARDRQKLLPYIQAAMKVRPDLRLWGNPWTGPEWLKDSASQSQNYGCGSLSPKLELRTAYARYLARAAKAYRAEGLNFEYLAIQNEPSNGDTWNGTYCHGTYPHMHWTGDQLTEFLRDHLGPVFESEGISNSVGIFLSTLPADDFEGYVAPTLSDPDALKYLAGVGLQYAGVGMAPAIKAAGVNRLKLWETETPCGNRHKTCGLGKSWQWGEGQWAYMRSFIEAGASVYSQWNMVLDETGSSTWGWSQCSPVTVNRTSKTVIYEGSYWATKHFSYFVQPGALVLGITGDNGPCRTVLGACGCTACVDESPPHQFIAFKNPTGQFVIVALNANDTQSPVLISIDGEQVVHEVLPAHSMSTFIVELSQYFV